LHAELAAEFIENLIFVNGADPALSLARNESHFRAYKRLPPGRRQAEIGSVGPRWMQLPGPIVRRIEDLLDTKLGNTQHLVVSDSEDRVLRVHFSSARSSIVHVRASFDGRVDQSAYTLLRLLSERGFDVLGSRLRSGLRSPVAGPAESDAVTFGCLDVFMRMPAGLIDWSRAQLEQLFALVEREFEASNDCHAKVAMVGGSGGDDDRKHPQVDSGEAVAFDRGGDTSGAGRAPVRQGGRGDANPVSAVAQEES
jgi:hypothetical protein